jgi:hypothetical protein
MTTTNTTATAAGGPGDGQKDQDQAAPDQEPAQGPACGTCVPDCGCGTCTQQVGPVTGSGASTCWAVSSDTTTKENKL